MATRGGFVENLGKIYGIYTGGFIGFVILMAILEQMGVPDRAIGYMFIGFTIAIYALIGIISRTTEISEYYVAGRRVPAIYNGMATGADWMSAASFISMAGSLYVLGYDGLGYVLGWTGGYVLVAVLLAPVSAQVRHLHRARLSRHPVRRQPAAAARHHRAVLRELHLHRGADRGRRHRHLALPADSVRRRGVRRPRRHPGVLDAGWHAGGDLDPGRTVHHPDHRLHPAGGHPVGAALRRADPGAHLRPGAAAHRRSSSRSWAWPRRTSLRS